VRTGASYKWIHRVWYGDAPFGWLLLPLSGLYWLISSLRKLLYREGVLKTQQAAVPVVVVGNITAGGTGKTPTVIWLVRELRARGFQPGIISRGYGGSRAGTSMRVDIDSDPAVVGDEPVLLSRRAECPVVVDADRVRAAAMLVDDGVDVIVADDGLQHFRLDRDFEICIVDGTRGFGNGWLLPAGPLRELPQRLATIDQVLVNGPQQGADAVLQDSLGFELRAVEVCRLNGSLIRSLDQFADTTVHAVAGIGNPARFFDLLRSQRIQVIEHAFADHAVLAKSDIEFGDEFGVFMTEKDAVKLGTNLADKYWYIPVDLHMDSLLSAPLFERIESRLRDCVRDGHD